MSISLPPPTIPLIYPESGYINNPWYQQLFLLSQQAVTAPPGQVGYLISTLNGVSVSTIQPGSNKISIINASGVGNTKIDVNQQNLTILTSQLSGTIPTSQLTGNIADSNISFTDITTGNVSTSNHGFTPKLPNDATKYLDGSGAFSTPTASSTGIAKVWVIFAGVDGSILTSLNVSSVTKNSTGNYTINFTSVLGNASYATVVTPTNGTTLNLATYRADTQTTGHVTILTFNTSFSAADPANVSVAVFSSS